jgi:hypothetical protein
VGGTGTILPREDHLRRSACLLATGLGLLAVLGLFGILPARAAGVVGTGTPQSCTGAALVSAMGGGGLVTFNCGALPHSIVVTYTPGIIPADHTTLDGDGLITLSGNGTDRLFWVLANTNLTLTQITLADGYIHDAGGAIKNEGRTVLDEVTIRDTYVTTSTWGGGAVYNLPGATLIVRDSVLRNNASAGGGAIYNEPGGHLLIENSQLLTNTAYGLHGGGIVNAGVMTITGGTFSGNVHTGSTSFYNGGGAVANLASGRATSTGTHFSHNTSSASGGAIYDSGVFILNAGVVVHNTARFGGGVFKLENSSLMIADSVLSENQALAGGGLNFAGSGSVIITNSTIAGNVATDSGGGILSSVGGLYLADSVIRENEAAAGGGLALGDTTIHLNRSLVTGNTASQDGGGIRALVGTYLLLTDSTVSNNTAVSNAGGGVNLFAGTTLYAHNSTVSGNSAATGGGVHTGSSSETYLWNVTVAENGATTGGGLFTASGVTTVLTNTLVVSSLFGGDCAGPGALVAQNSLASDATCALSPGNQNSTDPLLTALGDFGGPTPVHLPKLGSPAIDGVVGSNAPATDQRSEPRPQGGGYDIGAVERQPDDTELVFGLFLPLVAK